MPVGVPKVSFRLPGDTIEQWIDLYNRLYRQRVLFLGSDLDDELANQLIGIMVYLSAEDPNEEIYLYINSPGGSVTCGLGVFDMMHHVKAKVHTICVGVAASMASFVLAGGEPGLRLGFPHSRVMLHQPAGGSLGQASDVLSEAQEIIRTRHLIGALYAKVTGCNIQRISTDMDRDCYLSANEAKKYGDLGLIDQIAVEVGNVSLPLVFA